MARETVQTRRNSRHGFKPWSSSSGTAYVDDRRRRRAMQLRWIRLLPPLSHEGLESVAVGLFENIVVGHAVRQKRRGKFLCGHVYFRKLVEEEPRSRIILPSTKSMGDLG